MNSVLSKRKILNAGAIGISYLKLIPDLFKLSKHSLVIDCGANVGHISKYLSKTGAKVIAFEPDPLAFSRLVERCGKENNITLIQKGVWDKNAFIDFYKHKDSNEHNISYTVGSSIKSDKINVNPVSSQSIEVIDFIYFMQQQKQKIDLVKMDIEGAEIEILYKILETQSWHLFDRMYIETHETKIPAHINELIEIKRILKSKNVKNIKLNWI